MIRKGRVRVKTRPDVKAVLMDRVETEQHSLRIAKIIIAAAREDFLKQVKHTRPETFPAYADSFYIKKNPLAKKGQHSQYRAGNEDPVAMLVEFGAHPGGGETFTLNYRPLGHGLDAAAGR